MPTRERRKRIKVLADQQREHDRCVKLALEEQRLALRSLKRRVVPAIEQEKKDFFHGLNGVPYTQPSAPPGSMPTPASKPSAPPVKKPKKVKAPVPQHVIDVVMEEAKHERDSKPMAAAAEVEADTEEDIGGDAEELQDIAEQLAEEEADEGDEGDDIYFPDDDEKTIDPVIDPAMYERPHPPLTRTDLMTYYGLSEKKRNELWEMRRVAAREMDSETRRDLYADADAALYEAIRLLRLREENAAARKAELAARALNQLGRTVVLRDEEPPKKGGVFSSWNPFNRRG